MDIRTRHRSRKPLITLLAVIGGVLLISGFFYKPQVPRQDFLSSMIPVDTSLVMESSLSSGVYSFPFEISLKGSREGIIHYTLDGSDPDITSPVFDGPVRINESRGNKLIYIPTSPRWSRPYADFNKGAVLKAKLYSPEGKASKVFTYSYIVPQENSKLPVFSIVCDSADLFGYDDGIYVMGKAYEDKDNYVRKHINLNRAWWFYPGNYQKRGVNSIRLCYYEDLKNDLNGNASLRIHGNATRGFSQKSLRLTLADSTGALYDSLNIVLRNSGNDFTRSMIRDALTSSLINDFTQLDVSVPEAYSVYVNAEYWGLQWKGVRMDENFLRSKYKLPLDRFSIIEIPGELFYGKKSDYKSFMELRKFCLANDLSIEDNFALVESQIDLPGFIDYLLVELYTGNTDWPFNNVRLWKEAGLGDSKWKFMVYDLDYTFGYSAPASYNPFPSFEKNETLGVLYKSLLKNPEFRNMLTDRFAELSSNAFREDVIIQKVDSLTGLIADDVSNHIERWRNPSSMDVWENSIGDIKEFAKQRPGHFNIWLKASIERHSRNTNQKKTELSADSR